MTLTMQQRMARAIHAVDVKRGGMMAKAWTDLEPPLQELFMEEAAACEALLLTTPPTPKMIEAGENAMPFAGPTRQMWEAMVAAMIAEGK